MEPSKNESTQERAKSDNRMVTVRLQTDKNLLQERKRVEDRSDETIRVGRFAADTDRDQKRTKIDFEEIEHPHSAAGGRLSGAAKANLAQERQRFDEALHIERSEEDRIRIAERFQKRLIGAKLLDNERTVTNINLFDERVRSDLETKHNASLLTDEKDSHHLTQTALITRDQFLAAVSHDLRNPLSLISLSISLMRKKHARGEADLNAFLTNLDTIERSVASMARMINDLLDVERMANAKLEVKLERENICGLLRECVELFAPVVASKMFSMNVHQCPDPTFAHVDHDRVMQVLSNLIGNALKFAPEGGIITLSAEIRGNEIEISVANEGPGIPQERRAQIFEKFSQLGTNDRRGIGLGLYISKWIVEAHRGRIWVTSEMGKGSTFTFALPMLISA